MKSKYNIVFTDDAIAGLDNIATYIEYQFSTIDKQKYLRKFNKTLKLIEDSPLTFPIVNKNNNTRRALVAKLTSILFEVENEFIYLISIYDNRSLPKF